MRWLPIPVSIIAEAYVEQMMRTMRSRSFRNQTTSVEIIAEPPATVTQNKPTPTYPVEVDTTVPSNATAGFNLVGAKTLSGTELLDEEIVDGSDVINTGPSLSVDSTDIPSTGTFTMVGSGAAPSETLTVKGPAMIEVGSPLWPRSRSTDR